MVLLRFLVDVFVRLLEDVLKTLLKMSSKRLVDVLVRHLEDALKTSWKRLEGVWPRQIY